MYPIAEPGRNPRQILWNPQKSARWPGERASGRPSGFDISSGGNQDAEHGSSG
jgi:hypothetical protein